MGFKTQYSIIPSFEYSNGFCLWCTPHDLQWSPTGRRPWLPAEAGEYNRDQLEAIRMVRLFLKGLSTKKVQDLAKMIKPYLQFRTEAAAFQTGHLSDICTDRCFTSRTSACCGREGIATFFADVVVNALSSTPDELDVIEQVLSDDRGGFKCVSLTDKGCLWKIKPVVCEMFLCDHAKNNLAGKDVYLARQAGPVRGTGKKSLFRKAMTVP